jgi:alanine-synthesizing transaminase
VFSRRSAFPTEPNALSLALQAHPPAYDLTVANATDVGLPYPAAEVVRALDNAAARTYEPDPRGLLDTRRALARQLATRGANVPAEQVFLTSGTSEAYTHILSMLCDPGDEILVPQPSYPLLDHLARLASVHARPYPLRYDGQWHIDVGALRSAVTDKTRAVLVVSPNNPTGSYLKRDELAFLETLGLPLISDEVFADYALRDDPERVSTALCSRTLLVFSLFGLSKQAALPQWKLAWTAVNGPPALVAEACDRLDLICDTYLSPATPTQHALPELLRIMQPTMAALHARVRRNLRHVQAAIPSGAPLSVLDVEGGMYATLRLPATQSDEQWALELLSRDGVYVQPGYFFDFHEGAHVIISLLTPEPTFDEGLARVVARVSTLAG